MIQPKITAEPVSVADATDFCVWSDGVIFVLGLWVMADWHWLLARDILYHSVLKGWMIILWKPQQLGLQECVKHIKSINQCHSFMNIPVYSLQAEHWTEGSVLHSLGNHQPSWPHMNHLNLLYKEKCRLIRSKQIAGTNSQSCLNFVLWVPSCQPCHTYYFKLSWY